MRIGLIVIAMVLSVFGARLFQLQGLDPKAYAARADAEGLVTVPLPATRGAITDRNGVALARSVDGTIERGRVYELGGPEVLTFRQCLELMLRIVDRKNPLVSLPFGIASLMGSLASLVPFITPPLTADQVTLLRSDNVVSDAARSEGRTLEAIGIEPILAEAILPSYLVRYRHQGQFTRIDKTA